MEEKLTYEAPKLITYSNDDILDEVGPAQACCSSPGHNCPCPGGGPK